MVLGENSLCCESFSIFFLQDDAWDGPLHHHAVVEDAVIENPPTYALSAEFLAIRALGNRCLDDAWS